MLIISTLELIANIGRCVNYFSVDNAIDKIKNSYTKTLFEEVYSSYSIGNYRSAVVMLWSVVVTDLVLKLQELDSVYQDPKASKILTDIKNEQQKDPTSSKWEMKIVRSFQKDLFFFDTPAVTQMENLQNMRHISAHPVIDNVDVLHMPPRSLVYYLIQFALESTLTKDALFSSQMINFIISDLSSIKKTLTTFEDKERYFCHKFLHKMSEPILLKFLETFWKFSFRLSNSDADANRKNNIIFLEIIFKHKKESFLKFMVDKKADISNLNIEENLIMSLLPFLISKKSLLNYFEKDSIDIIKSLLTKSNYNLYEYLLFEDPLSYLNYLKSKDYTFLPIPSINALKIECDEQNFFDDFLSICIAGYSKATSFDRADRRFKALIQSNLDRFTLVQLTELIKKIDQNDQAYSRKSAPKDHKLIIERVLSMKKDFDFKPYKNFNRGNINTIKIPKTETPEEM